MKVKNLFRFPQAIAAARRTKGVSQKVLALDAGIDPTRLSAIERGRVIGPASGLVSRLCDALRLSEAESELLRHAAAHDRVMREITRNLDREKHQLLAISLDAAHVLSQDDCATLTEVIRQLVVPRQQLATLLGREGEAMT